MDYRKAFRVEPDSKLNLGKHDPSDTGKHESEEAAKTELEAFGQKLFKQQSVLYGRSRDVLRPTGDGWHLAERTAILEQNRLEGGNITFLV